MSSRQQKECMLAAGSTAQGSWNVLSLALQLWLWWFRWLTVYAFVLWRLRMNCVVRAEHVAQGGMVSQCAQGPGFYAQHFEEVVFFFFFSVLMALQ